MLANQLIQLSDNFILSLWPSSIVLMALDTNQPADIWHVTYVWSVSLSLNVATCIVAGLFLNFIKASIKRANEESS